MSDKSAHLFTRIVIYCFCMMLLFGIGPAFMPEGFVLLIPLVVFAIWADWENLTRWRQVRRMHRELAEVLRFESDRDRL